MINHQKVETSKADKFMTLIYASLFTMKGSKQIQNKRKNLTNY